MSESIHADGRPLTEPQSGSESDIRSLLENAFDEQAEQPTDTNGAGRQRGPDGKFVRVDAAGPDTTASEPTESDPPQKPVKSEAEKPEVEASPKPESAEPPATWKAEAKEQFKALPPEAQNILLTRHREMEADYSRKTQDIAAFRRDYEPIQQMLAPHDQQMRAAGFTPQTLIQAWMGVEQALMSGNGVSVVRDIVRQYKIDPRAIARELGLTAPGAGTEQPPAPVDGSAPIHIPPELTNLLQTLSERQRAVEQTVTTQQQAAYREQENRVMNTITAFKDAKDIAGNLMHPHYEELEAEMVDMLRAARASGQEPTLEQLYDKAVWANTSTREKTLTSQRAAEEAQRKADEAKKAQEARAKAERARKAGSSVTGAPGSGQAAINGSNAAPKSVRDAIDAAMEEHADA